MDIETARFLAGAEGGRALEAARASRDLPPRGRLQRLAGLTASAEDLRAALQQDDLRRRAARRCPHAERLLFTPEALEQASAWPVACERATRWPGPDGAPLTDLGAGIGLDALATAEAGRTVVAFERDAARAHLLAFNARALGLEARIRIEAWDVADIRPEGRLAFLDPDRRPGGRRTRDPEAFEPPRSRWTSLLGGFGAAMIKVPPAAGDIDVDGAPQEVVSLAGRARERRIFVGTWPRREARRALRLPQGTHVEGVGRPWPTARGVRAGDWLLDPDAAVTLAGLVGDLALRDDLVPLHPRIAYLLGAAPNPTSPGVWMQVDAVLPVRARVLNAWLAARGIGRLTLRKRGVADKVEGWRRRLKPRGEAAGTIVFTRNLRDRWIALGCL